MQDSSNLIPEINANPIVDKIQDWGTEETETALTRIFEVIALSEFEPEHEIDKMQALWDIFSLRKSFRESWKNVTPQTEYEYAVK